MNVIKSAIIQTPGFVLLSLSIGCLYAFLLYSKKRPWSFQLNILLAVLRVAVVSSIVFLLLSPYLRQTISYTEKPSVVLLIDDSESIKKALPSAFNEQLRDLSNKLASNGLDVALYNTSGRKLENADSLRFDKPFTNLTQPLLEIQNKYENRNLAGVVLVSDGIFNRGTSPLYQNPPYTLYTVGIGDTQPKKDLLIKSIYYNKIASVGNRFPLVAEIRSKGFAGKTAWLTLNSGDHLMEKKPIHITTDDFSDEITFLVPATKKGIQHFRVNIQVLDGEFSKENNTAHAYVEVLENKQKILICALAPHPDIKAIRSALESNETNEVTVFIPGIGEWKEQHEDVIIFHQIPSLSGTGSDILSSCLKKHLPFVVITGSQTDITQLNTLSDCIKVMSKGGQTDKVTPAFNPQFSRFLFDEHSREIMSEWPPLQAPFGEYNLSGNAEAVVFQQVGSVRTTKPLVVTANVNGSGVAFFLGEGCWQWRMAEYNNHRNTSVFDDFWSKLVQLTTTKNDKRKFRVSTSQSRYIVAESVVFQAELYNDLYEKTFGQEIEINLSDESGKTYAYTYLHDELNPHFQINGLLSGVYNYKASCVLNGKKETASGQFTVADDKQESTNTVADFGLLRNMASLSGGEFIPYSEINKLTDKKHLSTAKGLIHTKEDILETINLSYILFVLILFICTEWFLRKYSGGF